MEDLLGGEAVFAHLLPESIELVGQVVDFVLVSLADRRDPGKFTRSPQCTVRLGSPLFVYKRLVEAKYVVSCIWAIVQV